MRLARIATPNGPRAVVLDGDQWAVVADLFAPALERTGETHPVAGTRLLAPVEPRVVLGMAHNTAPDDRALAPQAFHKSVRTVVGPGDAIVLDPRRGTLVAEAELVLVIGRECRNVTAAQAPEYILGWTGGNDLTAVDQSWDDKLLQVKNGDGFTPLGPWIETDWDGSNWALVTETAGGVRAEGCTDGLAWNPFEALEYLSSHLTLGPGDIVLTGAPHTSVRVVVGDEVSCTVAGVGTLVNPVRELVVG